MGAGIDFGTTLVKAVWEAVNGYRFLSSADHDPEAIGRQMTMDGVTRINIAGRNTPPSYFNRFETKLPCGKRIEAEIKTQALGARKLLEEQENPLEDFLLVSIGTGTVYAKVSAKQVKNSP